MIADLSAMAAVGYVLAGGIGAAALAMVGPLLMHSYARSGGGRSGATAKEAADQGEVDAQPLSSTLPERW